MIVRTKIRLIIRNNFILGQIKKKRLIKIGMVNLNQHLLKSDMCKVVFGIIEDIRVGKTQALLSRSQ